jgi:protein TonB
MAGRDAAGEAAVDRLFFGILIALAVHAGLILGVGFSVPRGEPPAAALEITLAPFPSDAADEAPVFLAASNQKGSGDSTERVEPRAALGTPVPAQAARPLPRAAPAVPLQPAAPDAAITASVSPERLDAAREPSPPTPEPAAGVTRADPVPSTEIASLLARLDEQARAYAKRPRVQRMTSASTRAAEDAAYLLAWTERVETVGNRNYPVEARNRRIMGDLRLLVAVRADGGVTEIRVLKSSGHAILDNAAVRIVRLSAPFAPIPPELRERHDLIEIIRTWQFRSDRVTAGN